MADKIYGIRGSTLTNIGDAIRAKTGTSDKIDPNDMPAAINSIVGGGGSAEGFVTVTFMNGDEVLLSRPVYIGDNCPDPVAQGRIETPTKESTIDTAYTFNGWSGSLANITEDKTVEAVYTEAVREYTVRFYDGETLLHTEHVPYGGSFEYTYTKDNHIFHGWSPEPTNIFADTDCYAILEESYAFADASWEYIADVANRGLASKAFSVGDEKETTLTYADGSSEKIVWVVSGFSGVSIEVSQVGSTLQVDKAANLVLTAKDALSQSRQWNNARSEQYVQLSFVESDLSTWLNEDFYSALPDDMRSRLQNQYVSTILDTSSGSVVVKPGYKKVSLMTACNVDRAASFEAGFGLLDYYSGTDASPRKKCKSGTSTTVRWWLATNYEMDYQGYQRVKVVSENGLLTIQDYVNTTGNFVVPMVVL